MSEIRLNIDGREVVGFDGQTILDIARENDVDIPTLCHDDRVKMYGSCGLCVVEAEGSPKLLRSCSTFAADGMVIRTRTPRVDASRKTALELLLSDHTGDCRPPCVLACPAQTDCQGYVGLIAMGEYKEAVKLIKDKIPLPASIGRVCPHPCEEACRRELVEEPISIAALKAFAGDIDLQGDELYTAEVGEPTGKRVAVVGGGPGGLTAAYFLRVYGHDVDVYDAMPHMGGMLRYGIPEYRLPKKLLQREIDAIGGMGVGLKNKMKIGRDLTLAYLRENYDVVIVAVGAWQSTGLRCPGEELGGVIGGIDFLREVTLGKAVFTGRKIAVVGGGNTAMDACRTAVRLGAETVYNIYRRTRNEMPAEEIEIDEAEQEGVIFKNLTNPIEVLGENGKVTSMRLQIMELGEPDASGRRAPVPVKGAEESVEVDTVIVAIGQKLDALGLEDIEQTKWRTIAADEHTFRTNLDGVFAIGDATNNGADIAISAIGEAKKAVEMVDRFLAGEVLTYEEPYLVKDEKTAEDFADRKKEPRAKMPHRSATERRGDFLEVNLGFSEEEARREGARCLECGCHDYFECKLIDYANQYRVRPEKFDGVVHHRPVAKTHPFINRNPDKCILCGLCVRICDEVVGATALGLVERGFDTVVKPALDIDLRDTDCISCGQCVAVCPTGALTETMMAPKQVPVRETVTETVCSFCSVGCKQKLTADGDTLFRSLPAADREKDALLCMKGRFGFGQIGGKERLTAPLVRGEDGLREVSFEQSAVYINKRLQAISTQYGSEAVAVAVSERYTNEEAGLIKAYAQTVLHTDKIYSLGRVDSGLADVLGKDASTCTFDELENTDLILLVATELMEHHPVAGMKVRRAVDGGAKLVIIGEGDGLLDDIAAIKMSAGIDLDALSQVTKALLDAGCGADLSGREQLAEWLAGVKVGDKAGEIAQLYRKAKKAVILFQKNTLTRCAARLIADLALVGGHAFGPRNGIIQLLPGANAQGLSDLGFGDGRTLRGELGDGTVRGLFLFGEDVAGLDLSGLDFLAVQDLHRTTTAGDAHAVLPASSFAESDGTYTAADGRVQPLHRAIDPAAGLDNREQIRLLAEQAGCACLESAKPEKAAETAPILRAPKNRKLLRDKAVSTNELYVSLMEYASKQGI